MAEPDKNPITGMSKEEEEEYREAFRMFDIDGSGTIEFVELKQVMLQLGQNPSEDDLMEMIQLVDVNGDNEIDFDEFLVMMTMRAEERDTDGELLEAFKLFDADGSGNISREELTSLMKNLGQDLTTEEIEAMIDEVDEDRDGEISFEEFKKLMID